MSLGQAGPHEMFTEQPPLGGILESVALGELDCAELGMDAQQLEAGFARLVDQAAGGEGPRYSAD